MPRPSRPSSVPLPRGWVSTPGGVDLCGLFRTEGQVRYLNGREARIGPKSGRRAIDVTGETSREDLT